jgi:hypothetical protein
MANPWPNTLPNTFDVSSYSEAPIENYIWTDPEGGPVMGRRRFTAVPREVNGAMVLTPDQRTTLDTFYRTQVGARFSWTDVRGAARYYLFREPVQFTMLSALHYRASMKLLEFQSEFGGG